MENKRVAFCYCLSVIILLKLPHTRIGWSSGETEERLVHSNQTFTKAQQAAFFITTYTLAKEALHEVQGRELGEAYPSCGDSDDLLYIEYRSVCIIYVQKYYICTKILYSYVQK